MEGGLFQGHPGTVKSGWYTSYCNAFLFSLKISLTESVVDAEFDESFNEVFLLKL